MFFFIDPAKLSNTQTAAQAYGPVQGVETSKYRVTSKFQLDNATPAIAAFDGIVLVQPHASDPTLCNLALKVSDLDDSRTQFDKIDYIIYRGLLRNSFLTAATTPTLLPADPSNSGLVADIWANYTGAQAAAGQFGLPSNFLPPTADWLGFNRTVTTQTLEAAFADTSRLAPLAAAKAGKSLGTFAASVDAGIEFIVFDRFYQPTVADLRQAEMVFEVPTTPTSVAGHDASYETQRTRENILNYLDPAAYYTMHHRLGVDYRDSGGTLHHCPDVPSIMRNLLGSFTTKNCLYLDIRNELGGSLNFYRDNEGTGADQHKHIALGFDAQNLTPVSYYTNNWPIFSLVDISVASNLGNLYVAFRQAHNPRPLLYVDYGYGYTFPTGPELLTNQNRFVDCTDSGKDWSQPLPLKMLPPTTVGSGHPVWFVKLMCIRQEVPADLATTVPSAPPRTYALNNVFGPIAADLLTPTGATNTLLPGKRFMATPMGEGGSIVMVRKLLTDSTITMRAERLHAYHGDLVMPVVGSQYLMPPTSFDTTAAGPWRDQPTVETQKITLMRASGGAFTFLKQDLRLSTATPLPYIMPSLTLLRTQVQSLVLPALAPFSPARDAAWLTFTAVSRPQPLPRRTTITIVINGIPVTTEDPDESIVRYVEAELKLAGLSASGTYQLSSTPAFLPAYSLDGTTFVTEAAADGIVLPKEPDVDAYIPIDQAITYLQTVEKAYAIEDKTALDTATRLRVHYYGGQQPGGTKATIAGWVFDTVVQGIKYYDIKKGYSNPAQIEIDVKETVRLDEERMAQVAGGSAAYKHLLSHANENGVGANPSPYLLVFNKQTNGVDYIDIGHMLFGFEAWQKAALGTSRPWRLLQYPVKDGVDLAGIVGDLGPVVGEFVYRLGNPGSKADRFYYPLENDLAKFYAISNPDADSHSDADGLGLSNTYDALRAASGGAPVSLSKVFAVYYAPAPPTTATVPGLTGPPSAIHYSRKWLTLAKQYGFLIPVNESKGFYDRNQNDFYWIGNHYDQPFQAGGVAKSFRAVYLDFFDRVLAVGNVLYNQEKITNTLWEGEFLLNPWHLLPEHSSFKPTKSVSHYFQMDDIMTANTTVGASFPPPYSDTLSVVIAVLRTYFFPDLALKLKAENPLLTLH